MKTPGDRGSRPLFVHYKWNMGHRKKNVVKSWATETKNGICGRLKTNVSSGEDILVCLQSRVGKWAACSWTDGCWVAPVSLKVVGCCRLPFDYQIRDGQRSALFTGLHVLKLHPLIFSLNSTNICYRVQFYTLKNTSTTFFLILSQSVTHRCFCGFETSSSLRRASSSCARVLGGGRGGMAGSWMKGWPGWWPRRWGPLPMPPPPQEECVRLDSVFGSRGLDFFKPWALLK